MRVWYANIWLTSAMYVCCYIMYYCANIQFCQLTSLLAVELETTD